MIIKKCNFYVVTVLLLATIVLTYEGQIYGANPPFQTGTPDSLSLDLIWHWGDINLAPGSRGIEVVDWDLDGDNEVLMAHNSLIFAIEHQGDYQFAQTWSVPMEQSWGVTDLVGNNIPELWVLSKSGLLSSYQPYQYAPQAIGQLANEATIEVADAVVADVNGDNGKELIVLLQSNKSWVLRTYELPQLNHTWSYTLTNSFNGAKIQVGQMDHDDAIEIALSIGMVFDPVKGTQQWSYGSGFGRKFQVVDIDGDNLAEIIGGQGSITAFDVETESSKWEISNYNRAFHIADVAGDNIPEIIAENRWGDKIIVYDAQTQEQLWSVDSSTHGDVCGIGAGDADNDDKLDLLWGAGCSLSGKDEFHLMPISQRKPTFTFNDYDGPYQAVALQMDQDEAKEIIIFTEKTNSGYDSATHFVMDSTTNMREPDLALEIDLSNEFHPLTANVDDDPYEELILMAYANLYLLDHDGSRLARKEYLHISDASLVPKWVGDIDGDGEIELVSYNGGQVSIHNINTLEYEWQSINSPGTVLGVAVGDVDKDGRMEIVFHGRDNRLQAYDGQTRQLDWQVPTTERVEAVAIGNADGAGVLEIATVEDG